MESCKKQMVIQSHFSLAQNVSKILEIKIQIVGIVIEFINFECSKIFFKSFQIIHDTVLVALKWHELKIWHSCCQLKSNLHFYKKKFEKLKKKTFFHCEENPQKKSFFLRSSYYRRLPTNINFSKNGFKVLHKFISWQNFTLIFMSARKFLFFTRASEEVRRRRIF